VEMASLEILFQRNVSLVNQAVLPATTVAAYHAHQQHNFIINNV